MGDSSANPADTARKPTCRRRFKQIGAAFLVLTGLLAGSLVWPGWPLHPLASIASSRARMQGLELQTESPWLRLHTDGTLRLRVSKIRIGDAAAPDALTIDDLLLRWRLGDLFSARLAPESVQIAETVATIGTDEQGRPRFIALPSAPDAADVAPFTPADLPMRFLPAANRTLSLAVERARIALPSGLPVREISSGPVSLTLARPQADHLDLAASLDLRADQRAGSLKFDGSLALVRDWLGRIHLEGSATPDDSSPATRVTLDAARTASAQTATLALRVNDCSPGAWLALLSLPDLPAITGQLDLELDASGDPLKRRLDDIAVRLKTTALTLSQPTLLTRPLDVSPVDISLRIEDHGARGRLDAFSLDAGPLSLGSTGVSWKTEGKIMSGGGRFTTGAVALPALLEWLPPEYGTNLPFNTDEASEIGLAATETDLDITGDLANGPAHLRFSSRGGLDLNRERLAIEASGDIDAAARTVSLNLALPDFVQARWQLAVLRRLTLPDLAAPLRAEISLRARWPDTIEEARWSVIAGEGHVVPKGPSLRWLARPFPITSFTLAGGLRENHKKLSIDTLELVSGRARLALERTELRSSQSLTTATGGADARVSLMLERWYAADFLPLLGPGLQTVVAPVAEDIAKIGLERLVTSAELGFANRPWNDPSINTLNGTQNALVRIGDELVPLDAVWSFDPATRRVSASLGMKDIRPDRLRLSALKNTPIPAEALDLSLAAQLDVSADPYAQSIDRMQLSAGVRVTARDGRIRANPLLAADLPVKHLELSASARILPLRLEKLRAFADFDGPQLLVEDTNLDFGATGRSGLQLTLRDVPLDWARARVPADWIPVELKDASIRGRLTQLGLRAEFFAPTAAEPAPKPASLALSADIRELAAGLPGLPEVSAPRIGISGGLDKLDVTAERVSTDGLTLSGLSVSVSRPLEAERGASAQGSLDADLSRIPAILTSLREQVAIPLDLTGLAGRATVKFNASAPLAPDKLAASLKAKTDISAEDLVIPPALLPAGVTVGPSALALSADVAGENASGSVNWRPASLVVAPWLKGAPIFDATFTLSPQTADTRTRIDLAATVIDAPEICWSKSAGRPASVSADARYTPSAADSPARVTALISTSGLVLSPLGARIEADLSDDRHPGLNLADGIARVSVRDAALGATALELDATRAPDGATRVDLRSPRLDLAGWIVQLEPLLSAWNRLPPPPPAGAKPAAPATPPAGPPVPPLALPALDVTARFDRVTLAPSRQLTAVTLDAALRDGLPSRLKFSADAGPSATLRVNLDTAASGRQPWNITLTDLGDWLNTATAPLALLPADKIAPGSTFDTLRALDTALIGGDLSLKGTADLRDAKNTLDGSAQIERLTLEQELTFLAKIAALVKKRVILQVPFKVFDMPAFTASPARIAIRKMRIDGPLDVTSDKLVLDFANDQIDMNGKVLGVGFEVAGPLDDPRFYLSEKNIIVKGLTTQDDFDW